MLDLKDLNAKMQLVNKWLDRVAGIPELKVKKMEPGKSYWPVDKENTDPLGYLLIPNLMRKPKLKPEYVSPRIGVGAPCPRTGEMLYHVEFPEFDEEITRGRTRPEFGYKFSKPKETIKPLGMVIIEHSYGTKGMKQNDRRYSDDRNNPDNPIVRNTYHFLYLEEEGYYTFVDPKRKKNPKATVKDPMVEYAALYKLRQEEADEMMEDLSDFFYEFRDIYKDALVERSVETYGVVYDLYEKAKFEYNGDLEDSKISVILDRIQTIWLPFLDLAESYVRGMMVSSKIKKHESEFLVTYVQDIKKDIDKTVDFLQNATIKDGDIIKKRFTPDMLFHSDEDVIYDVTKNSDEEDYKTRGPVRDLKEKMVRLVTPRKEKVDGETLVNDLKISKKSTYFVGYLDFNEKDEVLYPSLGEIIRKEEPTLEQSDDKSEEVIRLSILEAIRNKKNLK